MLITVYCVRRDLSEAAFTLQVSPDFELRNFRVLCELESGIPADDMQVIHMEQLLTDDHCSLGSYGLKNGDVVVLLEKEHVGPRPPGRTPKQPWIDFSGIAVPGTSSSRQQQQQQQCPPAAQQQRPPAAQQQQQQRPPAAQQQQQQRPPAAQQQQQQRPPAAQQQQQQRPPAAQQQQQQQPRGRAGGEQAAPAQRLDSPTLIRSVLLSNPHDLSLLKERNPRLADALLSGNLETFSQVLMEQQRERTLREQERIRLYSADPFDLEAQAKIEEEIRQQNIEENMNIAMEEAPESFGQVAMLYINCKVNGHPLKAFVDSGAQMTIMSQACADRCNITRLVDRRWAGVAKGVGTQRIIGRVHLAQIQIEGDFLQCSFSILEEQPMDMLLGLDMLKRHQCCIDLKKNVLVIGTTGTQTYFLPEGELPSCAKIVSGTGQEESSGNGAADAIKHSFMESGRKKH